MLGRRDEERELLDDPGQVVIAKPVYGRLGLGAIGAMIGTIICQDATTQGKVASLMSLLARQPLAGSHPRVSYDRDGRWVVDGKQEDGSTPGRRETLTGTKKFDLETGEDAKGRWC
jgi:hypothetical protein